MTHRGILLTGQGVAVATAGHLLDKAGFAFRREPGLRRGVPVIMLSDAALALLRDVFGNPALFATRARITRRVVRWGGTQAVEMPHGAVVVSQDDLDDVLDMFPRGNTAKRSSAMPYRAKLNIQQSNDFNGIFTVHAQSPFPREERLRFGERISATARVTLTQNAPVGTCWIEAVGAGWLFLIPDGNMAGGPNAWLLAVGDRPEALVQDAPLIAPLIYAMEPAGSTFDTSPRMLAQLAGEGWLACGTAAIAFDPICGDGTAQAVREGILASAVIGAVARGESPAALATHYHSLLLASLRRHLQLALPFYANGGAGKWWHAQYAAARAGYDRTTAMLAKLPEPRFALHGFDLVARTIAA